MGDIKLLYHINVPENREILFAARDTGVAYDLQDELLKTAYVVMEHFKHDQWVLSYISPLWDFNELVKLLREKENG